MEDFKVKDISQADFGRKEISIARNRNARINGIAKRIQRKKPLKGARMLVVFT